MKYIKQFTIILSVTCVGEIFKYLIDLPVPGSIYGLILMLLMLMTGAVKLEDVKEAALIDGVTRRQMITKIILPLITLPLLFPIVRQT